MASIESADNDINVGSVDVDNSGDLAAKYSIRNVPTMYIFRDGEIVGKMIGAKTEAEIIAEVTKLN